MIRRWAMLLLLKYTSEISLLIIDILLSFIVAKTKSTAKLKLTIENDVLILLSIEKISCLSQPNRN
jgi:hypothetical protein